jgi:hypothetical protein
MDLQTEFEFKLPKGFIDNQGNLHREGAMRLATAMDEITPLRDPRVRSNEAYLVTPEMIESFFAADIVYLQDLYRQINEVDARILNVHCPNCSHHFEVEVPLLGES